MLWVMLTVPLWLVRPPPTPPDELLAKVLLLMLTVPPWLRRPPPSPGVKPPGLPVAKLLAKVLLLMLTVPKFSSPPPPAIPPPGAKPWAMVRALSVKLTPLFTTSTCTWPPPERVTCCPLPSRVRFLLITSFEPRVIVPLQPKVMVSPLAALLMALRRVASSQVLPMLVTAGWAWAVLLVSPRLASRPTPSSRASPTRRAQDERRMVWC